MKLTLPWWLPVGQAPEISSQDLKTWLAEGRPVQIVDARTALEYASGTIRRAHHAPLVGMPDSLERVPLDPQHPVVVLCLSGHRSLPGTRWLRRRGYRAFSLQGGLLAWRSAGNSLVKPG